MFLLQTFKRMEAKTHAYTPVGIYGAILDNILETPCLDCAFHIPTCKHQISEQLV